MELGDGAILSETAGPQMIADSLKASSGFVRQLDPPWGFPVLLGKRADASATSVRPWARGWWKLDEAMCVSTSGGR